MWGFEQIEVDEKRLGLKALQPVYTKHSRVELRLLASFMRLIPTRL